MDNTLLEKILPSFRESTKETFETMAFTPLTIMDPTIKKNGLPSGAISGTISITGDSLCGSVSLIFNQNIIEGIFRAMMMMGEGDSVDANELKDAVGELANMVAGGAKSKLQEKKVDFVIGLPTVVVGENHHLEGPADTTTHVLPLESDKGTFFMELTFS